MGKGFPQVPLGDALWPEWREAELKEEICSSGSGKTQLCQLCTSTEGSARVPLVQTPLGYKKLRLEIAEEMSQCTELHHNEHNPM